MDLSQGQTEVLDWLHNVEVPDEGGDCDYREFFDYVDALIMGHNSFEKVLEFDHWPYQEKPVIVLCKSLTEIPGNLRGLVTIDSSSPEELMEKLSQNANKHIYLDGRNMILSFLRTGLVDDITLTRIPILIGQRRPLFGELPQDVKLNHLSTQSWDNGFVQSVFEVADN